MEACVSRTPTGVSGMLFMLLLGLCPGSELGEVDLLVFVYMELLGQVISMYTI